MKLYIVEIENYKKGGFTVNISIENSDFLNAFDLVKEMDLDTYRKDRLNLYALKVNANEFNYNYLQEQLVDPMIDYSISREVKKKYAGKPGKLFKKARERFKEYTKNEGELGELMLFCFLETHLNAPKILTKLELKTSTSLYVNGADGVQFLKLDNGDYQLIFGESKMYSDIKLAFANALKSIRDFKNEKNNKGESKSGIGYEKSLISDNLSKESFSDEEKAFLESLIYPSQDNVFYVDDAFGIFIGFQIDISEDEKELPNREFRELIKNRMLTKIEECLEDVKKKIKDYKLQGHNFYIYAVPFTNIDSTRKEILKEVIE